MDSITQIFLGASAAAIVAPAIVRRKALLLGAILGTLPDLDVFLRFGNAVEQITYHRGFSHSLFVLPWVGLLIWMGLHWHWQAIRAHRLRWFLAIQVALITHPLLDAFTVYGTQLFWPLPNSPIMIGSIFVIDALYTLPLIVGVIGAWRLSNTDNYNPSKARFLLTFGIMLSSIYLSWTIVVQHHIYSAVKQAVISQGFVGTKILVTPTPLNSIVWRILVMRSDGSYDEGFYNFLSSTNKVDFENHMSNHHLLAAIKDEWSVKRMQWFTNGFYAVEFKDNKLILKDLRMGEEGAYIFSFILAEQKEDGEIKSVTPHMVGTKLDIKERIRALWGRFSY